MSKLIKGTHHIALKCVGYAAFQKTVSFYVDTLGLEVVRTWGEGDSSGIMLDTGNSMLEIFANGTEDAPEGNIRHFALETDDVEACVKAVREAGYTITVETVDKAIPSDPPFPIRIAFCIGPVGESLEFFHAR